MIQIVSNFYIKSHQQFARRRTMAAEVPIKPFTVLSAAGTHILVNHLPYLLLSSTPSYLGTFVQLWISQFVSWAFWRVIIWPKFVSPLRDIPGPKSGSWWNGQFATLYSKHSDLPMTEWCVYPLVLRLKARKLTLVTGSIPFKMAASFGISACSTRSAFSLPLQTLSTKF